MKLKFKIGDRVRVLPQFRHIPEDTLILKICDISTDLINTKRCYCAIPVPQKYNYRHDYINWYDEYELIFAENVLQRLKKRLLKINGK